MIFPRDKNHSKGAITCLQLLQTAVPARVPWATLTPTLLNYPTWQVLSPYARTDLQSSQNIKDI